MNKKSIISTIVMVLLGAAGLVLLKNTASIEDPLPSTTTAQTQRAWKAFQIRALGFSIKYPPQYSVKTSLLSPTTTAWSSMELVSIFDPRDTSNYEFHVVPVRIVLQRQPMIEQGNVYHTARDFLRGEDTESGASSPKGKIVTLNGEEAIHYSFPAGDAEDAPVDAYYFIKNDFIYQVFFNANDPYRDQMLKSIVFSERSYNPTP